MATCTKPSVFEVKVTREEYEKQKDQTISRSLLDECIKIFKENTQKVNDDK